MLEGEEGGRGMGEGVGDSSQFAGCDLAAARPPHLLSSSITSLADVVQWSASVPADLSACSGACDGCQVHTMELIAHRTAAGVWMSGVGGLLSWDTVEKSEMSAFSQHRSPMC